MQISKSNKDRDEKNLMRMIRDEGQEWVCYWGDGVSVKYRKALHHSITYVAHEGDTLCEYSRSIDDNGFYVYVCDLLVKPEHRGRSIRRKLMECLYPKLPVIYSVLGSIEKASRISRWDLLTSEVMSLYLPV